jgi:hypothetical protein
MGLGCGFPSIVTLQYLIFAARRFSHPLNVPNGLWGISKSLLRGGGDNQHERQFPLGLTNSHEKTVCDLPIATRPICEASYSVLRLSWSLADETICPLDKVLHVRCVSVTAVVLAPDELASEQALVYGRHFCRPVVA